MAFPSIDWQMRFGQRRVKRTMTLQLTSQSWYLRFLMVRSSEVSKDRLHPFKRLQTVRRTLLAQMRHVANVAASLPYNAYSTTKGLFRVFFCLVRLSQLIAVGHR